MSRRKAKFRKGQVVRAVHVPGFHVVDFVWAKKFPVGFVPGEPLYQLHPDEQLLAEGSLIFRENQLRPLTRRERGGV